MREIERSDQTRGRRTHLRVDEISPSSLCVREVESALVNTGHNDFVTHVSSFVMTETKKSSVTKLMPGPFFIAMIYYKYAKALV